jgi:hypothetical protein
MASRLERAGLQVTYADEILNLHPDAWFRTEIKSTMRSRTANAPDGILPILAQARTGRNEGSSAG